MFTDFSSQVGTLSQGNPYTYTGRELDEDTGLYYYRARYYDADTGRFLQEDPIGFGGGVNFYVYVVNSPINFVDPLGLAVWMCNRPVRDKYLNFMSAGYANHSYFYNDQDGSCCGMASTDTCKELGLDGDNCNVVGGSRGREDELMDCCTDTADDWHYGVPWAPWINDCHTSLDRCLNDAGIYNPGAPGGRLGSTTD